MKKVKCIFTCSAIYDGEGDYLEIVYVHEDNTILTIVRCIDGVTRKFHESIASFENRWQINLNNFSI